MRAYVNNDNLLTVEGVQDELNDVYLAGAVVEVTLYDLNTVNEVGGQVWPLTLAYIAGSEGDYAGVLDDAVAAVQDTTYDLKITITSGGNAAEIWDHVTYKKRTVTS